VNALLTDEYQLTMLEACLHEGMTSQAVFELYVRRLPPQRNYLVAAGLEQALELLETLTLDGAELDWLACRPGTSARTVDCLRHWRFEGDVDAMPEGTVFFPDEPVLRITAPLHQAQFVETRLLNIVHYQTLVASKASRIVTAAEGRPVVDFGLRRAPGAEAGLYAARAAYIAGFAATATSAAGLRYGIPVVGTMTHSYVQAHASELQAFEAYARSQTRRPVLLVDTYDVDAALAQVVPLVRRLADDGIPVAGVRIEGGDLARHARTARTLFDRAGLDGLDIFASGELDEHRIARLLADAAPIDAFGVGTALAASSDAPALETVYKLQSYAGEPCRKRAGSQVSWPGLRQVDRFLGPDGHMAYDRIRRDGERTSGGAPLLAPVMRGGRRVGPAPTLQDIRRHHQAQMRLLPARLRGLMPDDGSRYPVQISDGLRSLASSLAASDCRGRSEADALP
jgi:nicotinate phosphoribosyltransferase